ncbi:MAG: uracil-DNA glycosylase [Acidobacteriota bacterium]|nr:uracil-DNA glycosylase [Acidobacteriota bacterium]
MKASQFVRALAEVRFANTFNPYADRCSRDDRGDAPAIRRRNLVAILEEAERLQTSAIWIGRDLGFRGGRRTGLALTDDVHVERHGERWGVSLERPTIGEIVRERTATVVWKLLSQVDAAVFLWNVFPFHPHRQGQPFSNRSHKAAEAECGRAILHELVEILRPEKLVMIGNDAAKSARRVCSRTDMTQVRHPSYGGQRQFRAQICGLYRLPVA